MSVIEVDESKSPLSIVTFPEQITDEDLIAYHHKMEAIHARKKPYALCIVGSKLLAMSASQRNLQKEYIERTSAAQAEFCRGVAFIAPSAFVRGIVTALHWLVKPVYTYKVFADLKSGVAWCNERLGLS